MARKPRPRYPNRDKILFRRFVAQGLLILCAIGLVLFYVYMNNSGQDPEPSSVAAAPAAVDAAASPAKETKAPGKTAASEKNTPKPGPAKEAAPAPDPSAQTSASGKDKRKDVKAPVVPYADKNVNEVGAALAKEFGTIQPTRWGEHLPGITSQLPVKEQKGGKPVVALTLDACGGKKGASYDTQLIAFLREKKIPATLFVTSVWMRANPETLRKLAADPLFEIAAHGSQHKPCSVNGKSVYGIKGTSSFAELAREVEGNVRDLTVTTGVRPRWFRSGTAYYDDVAVSAIRSLELGIAGYSVAGDEGATLPPDKVAAKTLAAKHGDILLYHMNKPGSGTFKGLKASLPTLLDKGFVFVKLSELP